MPELPEVETIRQDLAKLLPGSRIAHVTVKKNKIIKNSLPTWRQKITHCAISVVNRRGKLLIFDFHDCDHHLLLHMKMTGQLIYHNRNKLVGGGHGEPRIIPTELPNQYSHVIFSFTDGAKLFFNDMRQFGYVRLVNKQELARVLAAYGVEPLSRKFTVRYLGDILRGKKTALKNVFLSQKYIAGLGNIYADESCFLAGVRPTRRASTVTLNETRRLRQAIIQILKKSIAQRGTTFSSYRDGLGGQGKFVQSLRVYGRGGQPCFQCKRILTKTKIGGRGTVYCTSCQK